MSIRVIFVRAKVGTSVVKEFFGLLSEYRYAIIGGFAVSYYSRDRDPSKGDVDVLISPSGLEEVKKKLGKRGFEVSPMRVTSYFTVVTVEKNGAVFDLLVAERPWERDALSDVKVDYIDGVPVKVIKPEYLCVMKLYVGREKDVSDVVRLLSSGAVNYAKLRSMVAKYLGADYVEDLDSLLEIAKWRGEL